MLTHRYTLELGERGLEVRELQGVWPIVLVGSSQHFEYFKNLVDLAVAHEQGLALDHLCEDAAG